MQDQASKVSEKLYNPELDNSELKELFKKKKKLNKNIEKLKKKLTGAEDDDE